MHLRSTIVLFWNIPKSDSISSSPVCGPTHSSPFWTTTVTLVDIRISFKQVMIRTFCVIDNWVCTLTTLLCYIITFGTFFFARCLLLWRSKGECLSETNQTLGFYEANSQALRTDLVERVLSRRRHKSVKFYDPDSQVLLPPYILLCHNHLSNK